MGVILCEKHEIGGIVEVCFHLAEQVKQGRFQPRGKIGTWWPVSVCTECWLKYDLARFAQPELLSSKNFIERVRSGAEFEKRTPHFEGYREVYEKLRRAIVCHLCLAEAEQATKSLQETYSAQMRASYDEIGADAESDVEMFFEAQREAVGNE